MKHLYEELKAYGQSDFYPLHMPGHKRNQKYEAGMFPLAEDITEIDGFDNLHHAESLILQAQERAASLYGVKETFFSVNGSTAGLLSAVSAAVRKGGKMLTARNCHKAVYHAMYLRDIEPVYLYPPMEPEYRINGGILPEEVEEKLKNTAGIEAVLLTSPTYDGVVSDVRAIADIAHKYDVPLIVDEAHGAHFHFHPYFPVSAAELGADLVIQSFHKTLPSMTQTAVLHRCSDRISGDAIRRFMGIYQTSSPSYILMASMDACVNRLARFGKEEFDCYTRLLARTRETLRQCRHLKLIPEEISGKNGIFDLDRSKILISTLGSGLDGNALSERLRNEYHLEVEMAEDHYVTALTSVGDTEEGMERLCRAILATDSSLTGSSEKTAEAEAGSLCIPLKQSMTISAALEAEQETCLLKESEGRISAEFVYLYPPGIPLITPGEEISSALTARIAGYLEMGFAMQGMADHSSETIRVVKNG